MKKQQSNGFFPDISEYNVIFFLQAEILQYCERCSIFEFLQPQTCPQMKLSNLRLFMPAEDTGLLVHLFNAVCRHSSLSDSSMYYFVLVPPDTMTCTCHYSQKVRRQFKLRDQTSFSCLTGTLNSCTNWGRTFLTDGQTITKSLRL